MDKKDRVLASLYGMSTGDALGVPSSFLTQERIQKNWGWIDTFYPPEKGHIFHDGLKAGEYTDDTEQALALLNAFDRSHRVVPMDVVDEIMKWAERVKDKYVSPLGPSTARALKAIKEGADINVSGRYGNTNGSAMRISPVGLIHGLLDTDLEDLVADVYQTCIPTHNTTVCVSSASAIAAAVCRALRGGTIEEIIEDAKEASEIGRRYGYEIASARLSTKIDLAIDVASRKEDPKEALALLYDYFGGGDLAQDSIPLALALFYLGKGRVKETNEYAVNLGGDCDTNAAMAGAIAGAYSGMSTVPTAWAETIERVNGVDMKVYRDMIFRVAGNWHVSEERR